MDEPQDDLKWFGEGFDGFPKRLSEDTVQCVIYILNADFEGEAKVRERLRDVEKAAKELCKSHLREYIWQRDEFQLELTRDESKTRPLFDCIAGTFTYICYQTNGVSAGRRITATPSQTSGSWCSCYASSVESLKTPGFAFTTLTASSC